MIVKKGLLFACFVFLAASLASAEGSGKSYIMKEGASLWTLKGRTMTWAASLSLGQELLSASKETTKGVYKEVEYDLVKVKTDADEEGYVIDSLVARDARGLAVVTGTLATLYSQPRDTAVLSTVIPRMNLVAVWEVPGKGDFLKVAGFASDTGSSFGDKYLLVSDLSVLEKDVNAAMLLQAIKEQKKKEQKLKTLQIINQKYPGSVFGPTVAEIRAALDTEKVATEAYAAALTATDTVNIRDIPSIFGSVVVAIKKGETATATARTTAEYEINDQKGKWVKVSAPKEGWVFDAYVTAQQ